MWLGQETGHSGVWLAQGTERNVVVARSKGRVQRRQKIGHDHGQATTVVARSLAPTRPVKGQRALRSREMSRWRQRRRSVETVADDDPLGLLPNLFDLSIVLAIAFLLTALGALSLRELVDPNSDWILVRRTAAGRTEVLSRMGKMIRIHRLSARRAGGMGVRLGVAYELENGEVIYVPD